MAEVTVAISFFDNADTVLDTVRSVFAQTLTDWRLLLLDDGSTDGGAEVVRGIDDPRVRFVPHRKNAGTPVRLNELTRLCETELLARMDADDLLHPERLARSVAALDADPSLDCVFGDAVAIDARAAPFGRARSAREPGVREHFDHSPYIHSTMVARTAWLREHPYDERFRRCQDQELFVRTVDARRSTTLDAVVLYMREAGRVPAHKYATSMRGTRRVIAEHGHRLARPDALLATGRTWAKQASYAVAEHLGAVDALVRRRSAPLSEAEVAEHAATTWSRS